MTASIELGEWDSKPQAILGESIVFIKIHPIEIHHYYIYHFGKIVGWCYANIIVAGTTYSITFRFPRCHMMLKLCSYQALGFPSDFLHPASEISNFRVQINIKQTEIEHSLTWIGL